MKITEDIRYIGVNDKNIDWFEGQYRVPNGMSYNSYMIIDEKIAVMDTVDRNFTHEWLNNVESELNGRAPDYLIVHHMEPDHSANIQNFMNLYKQATVVASSKAFKMMKNFFGDEFETRRIVVGDGDKLSLGKHLLVFIATPMIHWPEVIVSYDYADKAFFSADGFGKFGVIDSEDQWKDEARRYYYGIVGKYGEQVQNLLKRARSADIRIICPLHGQILKGNIDYYYNLYDIWSSYQPESNGIMIAYTSVYGNTKKAVELLAGKIRSMGCPDVAVYDLTRTDIMLAISEAFRFKKLVLATTTYNSNLIKFMDEYVEIGADIFPHMRNFIKHLTERGYRNRTIGLIENGSWSPRAIQGMKKLLAESEGIHYTDNMVTILSALNDESMKQIDYLAGELCKEYMTSCNGLKNRNDLSALVNIGYGLYLVTSNDGKKDNGLIVNKISQVTVNPNTIAVCINKQNYSHYVIQKSGIMNVCYLSVNAPRHIFEMFGYTSGRNTDKFSICDTVRTNNGLVCPTEFVNSYMSLKVEKYIDLDLHGMFICTITEAQVLSNDETMTYNFYRNHVNDHVVSVNEK